MLHAPAKSLPLRRLGGLSRYHDYVRFTTPGGVIRLPLNSPKLLGVANTRGTRGHQEDFYAFATLSLDPEELRLSVKKKLGIDWDPTAVDEKVARQVMFVGIYDGHGGSAVAQYLRQELHGLLERVDKTNIQELFLWIKEIGGYFKRFRGGALAPWIDGVEGTPEMDLEARFTQAFFEVDRNLSMVEAKACGATSSVAIFHSLDAPASPFFSCQKLALTVAHCGDTRVLLCATNGGDVHAMTDNHHADTRVESARLRRMMGTALIADSFGETRWMGALANTRGLGDLFYKKYGVTPEPEVRTKLLENQDWAYVVLVSDGVSSVVSDDEVVDLGRNAKDPKEAADRILAYAEEMGSEDNATAIVVPLAGWGKITGPDKTKELREYRQQNAVGSERQRRMYE
ncbi:protein serine/threonine phosphatase 2C [Athelia psychrophila]|uniref:Protein serine/threonine phosphatase 2C n=1 Tax=Athelia psychrophila TaxID=1759441 RepID=A0A166FJ88_9AGAM|nr:protein serine/threonine phosphatase 2C [Fibularhizoctonia sp. CBS 109695]KZP16864.1 protein serine/threonine phosphatase 2C [Fibularhizoctonia sp. CBS 109695]